ncbi:MAG: 23S rRNA (guanosine(2251)-2'-O)-methyltransferase RlmB [Gammaproteobacteria bacterium]|nr:MAG: 23S rRNA (guanosine(2251)-2'-O)-methyltransferase RlmB [Gammaproteobacteria bacterium]
MTNTDYAFGLHAVESLLKSRPGSVNELLVAEERTDRRLDELLDRAVAEGILITRLPRRELDLLLPRSRHQGIMARLGAPAAALKEADIQPFLEALDHEPLLLVLDGVQDPHNLGACLRTADAAGVDAVIVPRDRAAGITPTVRKVASGAVDSVPVFTVTNLARVLRKLKEAGVWLYGASDAADRCLYDVDFSGPLALVLGSEGTGMRRLTQDLCDFHVAIPMVGRVSSLNVSVAAGVLLYEVRRQRNK